MYSKAKILETIQYKDTEAKIEENRQLQNLKCETKLLSIKQ